MDSFSNSLYPLTHLFSLKPDGTTYNQCSMMTNKTILAAVLSLGVAAATCGCASSPKPELPEDGHFDVCETPLDGDEGPNGFTRLIQVDVGRTGEGGEEEEEAELDTGDFQLDGPYDQARGFGYLGDGGAASADASWTNWAWPYGGRGMADLHLSTREGMLGYRFDVPDGVYAVTWHMIEKKEHWSGFRSAHLTLEGEIEVASYDIFEEAGNRFMATARGLAKVTDGSLEIGFAPTGSRSPPVVSAIEVEAIDPDSTPPGDVTVLLARGGYGQAILTWDPPEDADLRGYNIYRATGSSGGWERVNPRVVTARHWIDRGLQPGASVSYRVVAQDLFCNESQGASVGPVTILDHAASTLPVFEIELEEQAMIGLTDDVSIDLYVPATLTIDGGATYQVEIRNRGASTRYLSKPNLKVRLSNGAEHEGRNGFKLNSEVVDPMMIQERLAYDLFSRSDALAPKARYVHLVLGGEYMGVYTEIQEVDRLFFADNGIDDDGNLYRMGGGVLDVLESEEAYREVYEKKTNESDPAGHADLIAMIEALNLTGEHELAAWFDGNFDSDGYIDFMVVNGIVGNGDLIDGNQYIYHDTSLDRWHHVPWDYNNGTFANPQLPWSNLTFYGAGLSNPWWFTSLTRIYANPELRARYVARTQELLAGTHSLSEITQAASGAVSSASTDVALDPWMVAWERDEGYSDDLVPAVADYAEARIDHMSWEAEALAGIHGPVVINEIQADNTGQAADEWGEPEPWIELYNRGEETASLAGLCLVSALREPEALFCFAGEATLGHGEHLLVWADGEPDDGPLHAPFTLNPDGGQVGLVRQEAAEDQTPVMDVLFYGPQLPGDSYGRTSDGAQEWAVSHFPTPGN